MKNTFTKSAAKTLLIALIGGLFAGCAATRPIADTALGAGVRVYATQPSYPDVALKIRALRKTLEHE